MQKWSWRYYLALTLSISGLGLIVYFLFLEPEFNDWSFIVKSDLAAKFGDFIGGFIGSLFSLAGVLLLFETLNNQKLAFQHQQFESKFFELLTIYRQNVQEMEHIPPGKDVVRGRKVFVELKKQFGELLEQIKSLNEALGANVPIRDLVNITFIIHFIGVGESTKEIVDNFLNKYEQTHPKFIEKVIFNFSFDNYKGKKLDGHQSRLGHYYRHLYQMVTFIDKIDYLSPDEKYFYVKTLRAQMSTFELAIFFFNSLSDFGRPWRTGDPNLIMKYKIIKNIPTGFTFGVNPKDFYPMVYEEEERMLFNI